MVIAKQYPQGTYELSNDLQRAAKKGFICEEQISFTGTRSIYNHHHCDHHHYHHYYYRHHFLVFWTNSYFNKSSLITLMIIENRAPLFARSFALSRYNQRAVIVTLKASSFQNGSKIF